MIRYNVTQQLFRGGRFAKLGKSLFPQEVSGFRIISLSPRLITTRRTCAGYVFIDREIYCLRKGGRISSVYQTDILCRTRAKVAWSSARVSPSRRHSLDAYAGVPSALAILLSDLVIDRVIEGDT